MPVRCVWTSLEASGVFQFDMWLRKHSVSVLLGLGHLSSCFPGGSDGKESACNAGDLGSIPGSGRFPGEQPTSVFLPRGFHGQRGLVGYSPWGRKELNMTE